MDDTAETQPIGDSLLLTSVPSGKKCVLVGVSDGRGFGRHGRHKRPMHDTIRATFEKHKERKHRRGFSKHKWSEHSESDGHEWRGFKRLRVLRRLLDLGITKGCSFEVIHASSSGPVLVEVRGTRVALGQGLASKMLVKVVDT